MQRLALCDIVLLFMPSLALAAGLWPNNIKQYPLVYKGILSYTEGKESGCIK